MIRSSIPLLVAALFAATTVLGDEFASIAHEIPPGYEPQPERDEQGLWSEMEDLELGINKSALLLRSGDLVDYVNTIVCRVAGPYCGDLRV